MSAKASQTDNFVPAGAFDAGLDWLSDRRTEALAQFHAAGLPTRKTEDWKYTPIRALTKQRFVPGARLNTATAKSLTIDGARVAQAINGLPVSDPTLSTLDLGNGAFLAPLSSLTDAQRALVTPHLATLAETEAQPFAALNTALVQDGFALHLPKGVQLDAPVLIEWITAGTDALAMPRLIVIAEANSKATIIEHFTGDAATLTNAVTEVVVGQGAQIDHATLQAEDLAAFHIGRVQADVARDARFSHGSLNLGARLARREIRVTLSGRGSETQIHGLFAGHGEQHLDQHIHVDHLADHATSNQRFRGILADKARGVFTGRVVVPKGVRNSTAEQQNPNLLLSDTAHIDTRPQLEIYNNDVIASHGATVGRLDADAIFYLESRGIPEDQARKLLTAAFATDVLEAQPNEALTAFGREWLQTHVVGVIG